MPFYGVHGFISGGQQLLRGWSTDCDRCADTHIDPADQPIDIDGLDNGLADTGRDGFGQHQT